MNAILGISLLEIGVYKEECTVRRWSRAYCAFNEKLTLNSDTYSGLEFQLQKHVQDTYFSIRYTILNQQPVINGELPTDDIESVVVDMGPEIAITWGWTK